MASGRFSYGTATYVEAPAYTPQAGGVLDLAEVRTVASSDPALRGYMYESELAEATLGTVTGFVQSSTASMPEGASHAYETSGDPFTIFGAFGSDLGAGDDAASAKARAEHRLEIAEGLVVERALWETGGIIPTQATLLRSGAALKAKIAVGLLAEEWSKQNVGVPYFLGGRRVANEIAAQQLVEFDEEGAQVKGGVALINGAGFFAKTTIATVTPTADQVWLFISGKPVLYRGAVNSVSADIAQTNATANNRILGFALRTYVPSIDGPIYGALVDLTL